MIKDPGGDLLIGLSGHSATAFTDKMIVFGGITDGFQLTDGLYVFGIPQVELTLVQLCLKMIKENDLYPHLHRVVVTEDDNSNGLAERKRKRILSCDKDEAKEEVKDEEAREEEERRPLLNPMEDGTTVEGGAVAKKRPGIKLPDDLEELIFT